MTTGYGKSRISATIKTLTDPEIFAASVNPFSLGNSTAILESLNQELLVMVPTFSLVVLVVLVLVDLVVAFRFNFADLVAVIK